MPAAKAIFPVYAVVGDDRFLREAAVHEILRALAAQGDELDPVRIDGVSATPAEALDEARTPSLFAGRRVVIVDDADDCISAGRKAFEDYVEAPSSPTCLILCCDSLPRTTNLHKKITEHGSIVPCVPPRRGDLTKWIVQRAREVYGKRLAEAAAQRLREHAGDSLGMLDTELSKLTAYVGDRPEITRGDIDSVTGRTREEKVFSVLDAMAVGETAVAVGLWQQALATNRAAPALAIGGLAWSVRALIDARHDMELDRDLFAHAKKLFTDVAVLRRRLEQNPAPRLRAMQRDLLAADFAVKTGGSTAELAVEKFIVTHSVGAAPRRAKVG